MRHNKDRCIGVPDLEHAGYPVRGCVEINTG